MLLEGVPPERRVKAYGGSPPPVDQPLLLAVSKVKTWEGGEGGADGGRGGAGGEQGGEG